MLDVADFGEAVATEADVVALDQGRAEAVDEDARAAVARDDVARARGRAADGRRGVCDPDAVGRVALRRGPGNAGHANVVALDEGAGGRAHDGDAVPLVPGNDVAGRVRGAADGGAGRVIDQHAGHVIAQGVTPSAARPIVFPVIKVLVEAPATPTPMATPPAVALFEELLPAIRLPEMVVLAA